MKRTKIMGKMILKFKAQDVDRYLLKVLNLNIFHDHIFTVISIYVRCI